MGKLLTWVVAFSVAAFMPVCFAYNDYEEGIPMGHAVVLTQKIVPAKSVETTKPVVPAKPVVPEKPAETAKPVETAKTVATVKSVEAIKPVEIIPIKINNNYENNFRLISALPRKGTVDSQPKVAIIFANNAKTTYDTVLTDMAMESLSNALKSKYLVVPGVKYVELLQKAGIVDIATVERSEITEVLRGEDITYLVYAELQPFVRKQTETAFTTGMDMTVILPLKIIDLKTEKYLYIGKMVEFARDSGWWGTVGNQSVSIMALQAALDKAVAVIGTRM